MSMDAQPQLTLRLDPRGTFTDQQTAPAETKSKTETSDDVQASSTFPPPSTVSSASSITSATTSTTSSTSISSSSSSSSSRSPSSSSSSHRSSSSSRTFSHTQSTPSSTISSSPVPASSSPSSLVIPVVLGLLALLVLLSAALLWFFCFRRRRRRRPQSPRTLSGLGGWKGLGGGSARVEQYRDQGLEGDTELGGVLPEAVSEVQTTPSRSTSRGRPSTRSSVDSTSSAPYLLSDLSHSSTFNPRLEPIPTTSSSREGDTQHRSFTATLPSRSFSFSFLRKTVSPLQGLAASLFPGYRPPSMRTAGSSSEDKGGGDDGSAGVSRASSTVAATRTRHAITVTDGSTMRLLEAGEEEEPEPRLSEVREGRREVSVEKTRSEVGREGWTGDIRRVERT